MERPPREAPRTSPWIARTFLVVAATVALYVAGAAVVGWGDLRGHLQAFPAGMLLPLAGLSLLNYGLRFLRWEAFLRRTGTRLPLGASLILYFAAYLMVITPGKIGEVFKAALMRERFAVPLARGVPIVLAERIYDFLGVLLLAAAGLSVWPGPLVGVRGGLAAAAAVPALLALFHVKPVRDGLLARLAARPQLARFRDGLEGATATLGHLLGAREALWAVLLSTAAWACECGGMWLVCRGLGLDVPVLQAFFVYAAGTLVGSLSFLPGGLGGTEATIVWLLGRVGVAHPAAAAAALIVRLFTLWLAVLVGLAFWLPSRRLLLGARNAAGGPSAGPSA
jgi:glycosyltransferase 2 family protein